MRKLFVRRWVTITVVAAGLAGLTATSASASWDFQPPRDESRIVGPGCGNDNGGFGGNAWGYWYTSGSGWSTTSSADYPGPDAYNDNLDAQEALGTCDGTSYNVLTQASQTATFYWEYYVNQGTTHCQVYAYIPGLNAGDYDTRYDFWAENYNGYYGWLGWPGDTINQQPLNGWIHIADLTIPDGTVNLQVTLSNADPNAPDRWAGAGDMAFSCT